ncbi:MAG: alpha/beta fold hydrolase BchO [Pseudomonadota bacterium]
MDWGAFSGHWPNAAQSHFWDVRPHRWHVQIFGDAEAPALVLLHGVGGASHSWRDLAPRLARRYRVIAPDLPGHGFTRLGTMQRSSPDLMAQDLERLLDALEVTPAALVGHSAGGALALVLGARMGSPPTVGLNPALDAFPGAAGWVFPMMAKGLAVNPFVAPLVSRLMRPQAITQALAATGSEIDAVGQACYGACLADTAHVDGTLTMMAQWRPDAVRARLPGVTARVLLLTGDRDGAVPAEGTVRAATLIPHGAHRSLGDLGHLAHEEAPDAVSAEIERFLDTL